MSAETGPLQAALDSTASRLSTLELIAKQHAALIAALTPQPIPAPVPVPVIPPPLPTILWLAGFETGNLSEFTGAGDEVNTGNANSSAVRAIAEGIPQRTTPWVMKQAWLAPSGTAEASGTRMSRYPEINALCKAGTPFYYSWWDFFPAALSYGAGGWYNHWQVMSNDPAMKNAPIWVLGISGSGMTTSLTWSPNGLAPAEGPHAGEAGTVSYVSPIAIPVGQWVFFEVEITPRGDFTGALKVWMNRQVLFDLAQVKTQFPYASQSLFTYIANNCYGALAAPFAHYVDDVTVSLGRMP